MERKFDKLNAKLSNIAGSMNMSNDQLKNFENFTDKYKGKSQNEMEDELYKMASEFSVKEKNDMIKKLKMLQSMDMLEGSQKSKVELFIDLLSR